MEVNTLTVGEKIKIYLCQEKISQKELAQRTGISTAKLSLSLNGKRTLTYEELSSILWATNTTADMFISPLMMPSKSA
jgi:transcriptional regulator with XRE-family HTH domain